MLRQNWSLQYLLNETKSPLLIHPHVSIALGGKFIFGHFSSSVGFADINIHRGVFRTLSNSYDGKFDKLTNYNKWNNK